MSLAASGVGALPVQAQTVMIQAPLQKFKLGNHRNLNQVNVKHEQIHFENHHLYHVSLPTWF